MFESEYELQQFVAINKAMIPFKGRPSFKQNILPDEDCSPAVEMSAYDDVCEPICDW